MSRFGLMRATMVVCRRGEAGREEKFAGVMDVCRRGEAAMKAKFRGVMQSPVTPLKDDFSLDLATFEKVLNFHVRTGATAISWPHHKGESLNLTIAERKRFAEAAVKTVAGADR